MHRQRHALHIFDGLLLLTSHCSLTELTVCAFLPFRHDRTVASPPEMYLAFLSESCFWYNLSVFYKLLLGVSVHSVETGCSLHLSRRHPSSIIDNHLPELNPLHFPFRYVVRRGDLISYYIIFQYCSQSERRDVITVFSHVTYKFLFPGKVTVFSPRWPLLIHHNLCQLWMYASSFQSSDASLICVLF